MRRRFNAQKSASKIWDYLDMRNEIPSGFHWSTLRADFANAKSGFKIVKRWVAGACGISSIYKDVNSAVRGYLESV